MQPSRSEALLHVQLDPCGDVWPLHKPCGRQLDTSLAPMHDSSAELGGLGAWQPSGRQRGGGPIIARAHSREVHMVLRASQDSNAEHGGLGAWHPAAGGTAMV